VLFGLALRFSSPQPVPDPATVATKKPEEPDAEGNTFLFRPKDDLGRAKRVEGLFFLRNYPSEGVADHDEVDVDAWPDGVFEYTSAIGGAKTVHGWHVFNIVWHGQTGAKPPTRSSRRGFGVPTSPTPAAPTSNMGPPTDMGPATHL
jgi:hypothetical protein